MLDTFAVAGLGATFALAFLVTFVATPVAARTMRNHGIIGRDVHKLSKPEVPEMCGIAILAGLAVSSLAYAWFFPDALIETSAFLGTVLIAAGIGFIDDLHPFSARVKPLLTGLACLPILLLRTYNPLPTVPLVGTVRLTVVYPLLIPIAIAVTSNAVNMMDVMNGSMPGTAAIISFTATLILLFAGETKTGALAAGLLGAVLAFYFFNRYPAKVFGGDTGSLAVGAALGALSILGKIETVLIVALIPHIMNAFYGLSSVGRLYERRELSSRPIRVLDDGRLEASPEKDAPVTLARIILAPGSMTEGEVVRAMMILTLVSCIMAVVTYEISLLGRI